MSRDIGETNSPNNETVSLTSFSGGNDRGRCLQLTQMARRNGTMDRFNAVQMTEDQVREAVAHMNEWLES